MSKISRKSQIRIRTRGFTLIEVLVVIAIVSLLATIILASLHSAAGRARDTVRLEEMEQFRNALELYYTDHGSYPQTFNPGDGDSYSTGFPDGGVVFRPSNYVGECTAPEDPYTHKPDPSYPLLPNFVPQYMPAWPHDPDLDCAGVTHSWHYASDGKDYKLITHVENPDNVPAEFHASIDPVWDDGPNPCVIDGNNGIHIGYWTPGAVCWSI